MDNFNETTPVALLTVGQLLSLLNSKEQTTPEKFNNSIQNGKRYVYGLAGLASLLDCSKPTAQKIKDSGKISFVQSGRKLVFDADLVLFELSKRKKKD
jgi:hypothetical protein